MKRLLIALMLLTACREEAPPPGPVALTPEAVGFFCQMNILDHGGPKAQVHLDAFPGQPLFFSQARDGLAYLQMPEKDGLVTATYVTDMGTTQWEDPTTAHWIAADRAVYVLGSQRLGGMDQPEAVPFADPALAADFTAMHGGRVVAFSDLPLDALLPPEETPDPGDAADFAARLKSATESQ